MTGFVPGDRVCGTGLYTTRFRQGSFADCVAVPTDVLAPLPDGTHRAVFEVRFAGSGELVIDVDAGGALTRLEDRVTVPRQERTVEGRVRLERRPGAGGGAPLYTVTTVELPETVRIDVESDLIGRVTDLCRSMALVLAVDCAALDAALGRPRVDLPPPGETYLLPPECIGDDLGRRLDAYLDGSTGTGAGNGDGGGD